MEEILDGIFVRYLFKRLVNWKTMQIQAQKKIDA